MRKCIILAITLFMSRSRKINKGANPYILVILSFIVVILLGSLLLYMPFSAKSGTGITWQHWGDFKYYLDCFFVAVSATCVTGLNGFKGGLAGTFNMAGQAIVLVMIQIGGLGFITILTFLLTLFRNKMQFKNRYMLSQAVNSTNIADVIIFVRRLILISLSIELVGFLLGLPVCLHIFKDNIPLGIWNSVFFSVSAFNNAGFDILGSNSLMAEEIVALKVSGSTAWMYYYFLSYIMILIIVGGISFLVIIDIFAKKGKVAQFRTFTKIVLSTSLVLLLAGFGLFILTDGLNGNITPMDALFQSVTCRTAGFATFDQETLSLPGKALSCLLMFIGGSPLSTAGGIKTTTAFMIFLAIYSHLRGKRVVAFKRTYSSNMVLKAMSLMVLGIFAVIIAMTGIAVIEKGNPQANMENIFFEVFSGFGTVGLTANLTPTLRVGSKMIICVLMFLGRLGPMTFFQVFQNNINKEGNLHYDYIEDDFLVG